MLSGAPSINLNHILIGANEEQTRLTKLNHNLKGFETRFIFVIFITFMNFMDVIFQNSCLRKGFATSFTFTLLVAFMNTFDMDCTMFKKEIFLSNIRLRSYSA